MQSPLDLAKSISDKEIEYIAHASRGNDVETHKEALRILIFDQDCIVNWTDQYWYPYECVELTRWHCEQGHEREFAICNIIIAYSIIAEADLSNDPEYMKEKISSEYDKLPIKLRGVKKGVKKGSNAKYKDLTNLLPAA